MVISIIIIVIIQTWNNTSPLLINFEIFASINHLTPNHDQTKKKAEVIVLNSALFIAKKLT